MPYVIDKNNPHMGGNLPGGDPQTFCPLLWQWLVQRFSVRSVLDVGCGTGNGLREFRNLGCETIGIEGLPQNVVVCPPPVLMVDLGKQFIPIPRLDLVWCCEVVEHIEGSLVNNLLRWITNGWMLAMTHAVPGQPGFHHVNCQPSEYWIEKIETRGMKYQEEISFHARTLVPENNWFRKSGLIFFREDMP